MFAAMMLSGYAVYKGKMSLGSWIAVQSWVTTIFIPLNFLGKQFVILYVLCI